jgi:putative ABC transport system substrate-binding protein
MRRRDLLLAGLAAAWQPRAARAQQPAVPVIGFLSTRSPEESAAHTAAYLRGLRETGYVDGRNVAIEYRWAGGEYERLSVLAAELARLRVSVMAAGGDPSAIAAKAATATIPIAFVMGDDPMRFGLVSSLNRPGGNATGVSLITSALGGKRLEILCELAPAADTVALLVNPGNLNAEAHALDVRSAAQALGRRLVVAEAATAAEIAEVFGTLARDRARALIVANDPFFDTRRDEFVILAARHGIPAIFHIREFPEAGGLSSYGPSLVDGYHAFGVQTGRILKGANPADLPVVRPTRFEFVVNLKTAKALGLDMTPSLLARADEVIE